MPAVRRDASFISSPLSHARYGTSAHAELDPSGPGFLHDLAEIWGPGSRPGPACSALPQHRARAPRARPVEADRLEAVGVRDARPRSPVDHAVARPAEARRLGRDQGPVDLDA